MPIVSKVQLSIPLPAPPVARIAKKWVRALKEEAPAIYQKLISVIPDWTTFQTKLAAVSSKAYQPMLDPNFVSRAGQSKRAINAGQIANLKRSWKKYRKKLDHIFETVDGIQAKRYKEVVDLMEANFATGLGNLVLPFTGTHIEGLGCAPLAGYWLVHDVAVEGMLKPSDEIVQGPPFRICRSVHVSTLKAALENRLVQAGGNIVKANYLPAAFSEENDSTNRVVNGFRDPTLLIDPFTTGGPSHVDYIRGPAERFMLEVQVSVMP